MSGDERRASEQQSVNEPASEAMRLDGNAAAGILSEVFIPDLTAARAACANCGTVRAIGELLVYGGEMGTVMRCPGCDAVVLRVARTPTRLWLDPTGARVIAVAPAVASTPAAA